MVIMKFTILQSWKVFHEMLQKDKYVSNFIWREGYAHKNFQQAKALFNQDFAYTLPLYIFLQLSRLIDNCALKKLIANPHKYVFFYTLHHEKQLICPDKLYYKCIAFIAYWFVLRDCKLVKPYTKTLSCFVKIVLCNRYLER